GSPPLKIPPARPVPHTIRPAASLPKVEELPVNADEPPSRFTPPGGLHESMRVEAVEKTLPKPKSIVFKRGYHPLDKDQEQAALDVWAGEDEPEEENPVLENEQHRPGMFTINVRSILTQPYQNQSDRRLNLAMILAAGFLIFVIVGGLVYLLLRGSNP